MLQGNNESETVNQEEKVFKKSYKERNTKIADIKNNIKWFPNVTNVNNRNAE